ncbi:putative F-box protein At3g47150 [Chenopodium quinoa]|uniref:putative F-box protein At3g47150 n=1 Tax=Chenopodium quinoa TaxID=63459 RepID=UPI000B76EBC9|nr:putative F-box protein At3g47150 [Chenopodium quinoa]
MDMHLPEELLVNILIRLPVKLLLRFRRVCKSWCSLISHSDFILSHLHHNQVAQNYNVLLRKYTLDYEHDFYSLHSDNEEFNQIQTLDFPIDYFTFAGSVNGLICLWDRNLATTYKTVILWNPALKKCITLPELRLNLSIERVKSSSCFGFGYDVSSNDYKVVMLITYRSMIDDYSPDEIATAVFSRSRKSWKTLDFATLAIDTTFGLWEMMVLLSRGPRRTVGFSKKGLLLVFGKGVFLVIGEDVRVVNYVPSGPQTLKDMDSFMTRWQVDSYQESLALLQEGDDLPLSPASFGSGMYVGSSDNLENIVTNSVHFRKLWLSKMQIYCNGINSEEAVTGSLQQLDKVFELWLS